MEREHEEAMRADFAEQVDLERKAYRPGVTDADIDAIFGQRDEIEKRWDRGPHAEHWGYLSDAYDDWSRSPETMRRFQENVDYNGGYGLTDVQRRSQEQARTLTRNDRPRPRIERGR
ncbi:hypothetical protein [Nocardia sp. NPDC050710]|uniref:hypothetical protein n=1 Tax=Nocardia sp. NPDC050710 TaxID=3157220 RepID=UPI0033CFD051